MTVRLAPSGGSLRIQNVPLRASKSSGTIRIVGEAKFDLANLTSRSGRIKIDVYDRNKIKIDALSDGFQLDKPAWVYNEVGIPTGVPAPWTPVKVQRNASGLHLDVWGRRYTVGNTPFFAQIRSQDEDFLAEPMRVSAIVDGEPVEFVHDGTKVVEAKPHTVVFEQRFRGGEVCR